MNLFITTNVTTPIYKFFFWTSHRSMSGNNITDRLWYLNIFLEVETWGTCYLILQNIEQSARRKALRTRGHQLLHLSTFIWKSIYKSQIECHGFTLVVETNYKASTLKRQLFGVFEILEGVWLCNCPCHIVKMFSYVGHAFGVPCWTKDCFDSSAILCFLCI